MNARITAPAFPNRYSAIRISTSVPFAVPGKAVPESRPTKVSMA